MVFSRAVRRARGHPFFSLATVVAPTRSFARSFSFSPHSTATELSQTRSGPHGDRHSSVTTGLITLPVSSQQAVTPMYHWSNLQQHSSTAATAESSSLTGTVWSHREPTVRRSSPAHPRSWQALSLCPGRARKRYALCPHCSLHAVVIYAP